VDDPLGLVFLQSLTAVFSLGPPAVAIAAIVHAMLPIVDWVFGSFQLPKAPPKMAPLLG
jgi:hypothetical protein